MPRIIFIEEQGGEKAVIADIGQTLLEVARANEVNIEGACGGNMACATCHFVVDESWYKVLPSPSADEQDMLNLAYGLTPTSRLGCQITVDQKLDGLTLFLPENGETK